MAVVDSADSDVVPEFGVPLECPDTISSLFPDSLQCKQGTRISYGPISDGVTGSDGGGGRLMRVGVDIVRVLVLGFSSSEMTKSLQRDGQLSKEKSWRSLLRKRVRREFSASRPRSKRSE